MFQNNGNYMNYFIKIILILLAFGFLMLGLISFLMPFGRYAFIASAICLSIVLLVVFVEWKTTLWTRCFVIHLILIVCVCFAFRGGILMGNSMGRAECYNDYNRSFGAIVMFFSKLHQEGNVSDAARLLNQLSMNWRELSKNGATLAGWLQEAENNKK